MLRFALIVAALLSVSPASATEAAWALLREGGQVVLLRHAMANGTTEPANFDIEDCSTQRRLSERGKQQAREIGSLFATRAAPIERVLSSRYCRALETGSIAFEDDPPEKFDPLDLLSDDPEKAKAQNEAVIKEVGTFTGSGILIMITHLENIKALTGMRTHDGEAILVRAEGDRLLVLGRIRFN
jgi:phosphohistidine phosphatase SixA